MEMTWPLLARYLSGEATTEEKKHVDSWCSASSANHYLFESIKEIWEVSGHLLAQTEWENHQKELDHKRLMFHVDRRTTSPLRSPVPAGTRTNYRRLRRIHAFQTWMQIAAIFLIVIGGGLALTSYFFVEPQKPSTIFREISTERTQRANMQLTDGSKVKLSVESKLRMPMEFDINKRIVELDGEAYFDIAPDPDRPFVINTSSATIEVLGTDFGIRAYDDEDDISVVVVTGKVRIESNDREAPTRVEIGAGEQALYNIPAGFLTTREIPPDRYLSWLQNRLIFEKEYLSNVVSQLERWYDVDFKFENQNLSKLRLTADLDSRNLDNVLRTVGQTLELNFTYDGDETIIISRK